MHVSHAIATIGTDLLYLAPALALLGWLSLVRRYPGERLLVRLATRRPPPPRRTLIRAPRPRPVARLLRSGRMIGSWLAVRPPPPALAS